MKSAYESAVQVHLAPGIDFAILRTVQSKEEKRFKASVHRTEKQGST